MHESFVESQADRSEGGQRAALEYGLVAMVAVAAVYLMGSGERGTPDSTNYLNAALHLSRGHGYVTSALDWGDPERFAPLTIFAPLFPLMIAALLALGLTPLAAMSGAVAISYVSFALACCFVLRVALPVGARVLTVPLTFALLVQPALREALHAGLSDLFGAAAALLCAGLFLRDQSPRGVRALLLGVMLGLSILARWANLYFVVPTFALLALYSWPDLGLKARMLRVLDVGLGTAFVVLPVWARNLGESGTLMGPRETALESPLLQLGRAFAGAGNWFDSAHQALLTHPTLATVHSALGLLLFAIMVAAAATATCRTARALWTMSLGYGLLMVLSSSTVHYDPLSDTRFWLLTLPLATGALLSSIFNATWNVPFKNVALATWALVAGHATFVSLRTLPDEIAHAHEPSGYFAPHLDASKTLARARALHDQGRCTIASHDEFVLLPRIGTRPLRVVDEREISALLSQRGDPLCLLVIRDPHMPHTLDGAHASFRARVHSLAFQRALSFDSADDVAELWMTGQPVEGMSVVSQYRASPRNDNLRQGNTR